MWSNYLKILVEDFFFFKEAASYKLVDLSSERVSATTIS